jgi:hypothetical protein
MRSNGVAVKFVLEIRETGTVSAIYIHIAMEEALASPQ